MADPQFGQIAAIGGERDITRGLFTGGVLGPTDDVLQSRGGQWKTYREILRDDQVASTLQQRRLAVTSAEWDIEPGDETPAAITAADALRDNLLSIEFDRITDRMLYAIPYGWAVGECLWGRDGSRVTLEDVRTIRRERLGLGKAGEVFLLTQANPNGELMPDRKFWTFTTGGEDDNDPYGLGLCHFLFWPVFFKRNGTKFWSIFLDKFGSPTPVAKMPRAQWEDDALRRKVLQALAAIQTDAAVAIPDNLTVELMEATRGGAATYGDFLARMDGAISKVVLSQTMTTDDGSSLSQAKVHAGVADTVIKHDADLVCLSFSNTVARWLTDWNFGPLVASPKVWRKTEPEEDLAEVAKRDKDIASLGLRPTPDYILKTYGDGWQFPVTPEPGAGGAATLNELTLALERAVRSGDKDLIAQARSRISERLGGGPPVAGPVPPAPEFAELAATLLHRQDQRDIAEAARRIAGGFEDVLGDRLATLVSYLDETGDLVTFRRRLAELAEQGPTPQTVAAVTRAGFAGRLLGLFRGQR